MFEYYVISFRLVNGDFKEYYVYCDREDILERVKELVNKFFDKESLIDVYVYEHIKRLSIDELFD